jgi:predicted RNA binding protein YcfA (HicA-like mRNA interferase family)
VVDGYYQIVQKLLKQHGYRHNGNFKGSHERWVNADGETVCVPYNLKNRHTANGILKDAGIDKKV